MDILRQAIMCQGDTELLTMKWLENQPMPAGNFSMPHKCVNWDKLEAWAESRRISRLFEPGYLVHPTLGDVYIDGHGDPIGESSIGHEDD